MDILSQLIIWGVIVAEIMVAAFCVLVIYGLWRLGRRQ